MALAALVAAGVFWIDSIAEYDFAISILYLVVLVLVSFAGGTKAVVRAAQACIALTITAWIAVHLSDPSPASGLRCVFACIAISVTAALLVSRKRLEAIKLDLERSRSEVDLFANSVPFVLWRSNPQGEIEYLNQSWTTVTGLDRVSVLAGQRYNDVVHPDDLEILGETVSKAVAERTVTDLKVRVRQADGSYRWMQIYDNPAFSPITGLVERFGGLSDVHNEVMAKEELQAVRLELEASKAELANLTESVPQFLWRADAHGNIEFCNGRYAQLSGREFHPTIRQRDYLLDVHPDDRREFLTRQREAVSALETLRVNYRLRHADGGFRWMALVGRPAKVGDGSEEIRYYGGVSDIHEEVLAHQKVRELNETLEHRVEERTNELLRTERRYAGLFEVSNMTFAEMDFSATEPLLDRLRERGVTDLAAHMEEHPAEFAHMLSLIRTTRVNEALARLMGYDSVAELTANPPAQNAEEGPAVLLRQLEMYFDGTDHIDGRTVLVGKDGIKVPVYFMVNRLGDGLHLSSHIDLTEQERLEEMRRATQQELARANRVATVGALSASIAHELNQPIASLLIDAKTVRRLVSRDGPDIEKVERVLDRVERTAERAADIVAKTRENIVAGRRAVHEIDLPKLVAETADILTHDLARSSVELQISAPPGLPLIRGDAVELQQVLVNLVTNAADAMRGQAGPRRISVEMSEHGDMARVRVADTGPGIPEENLDRLFEPFFTTKSTGIGMGLQICRSAVETMGGQLTVTNGEEGGACFTFDLPLASRSPVAA
ncbi:PAS domain-containing sensor histidine kinase [Sphingobium yanoikuyae]|uniref:PAS domain-containing sensor histidine kinase n=1 Tax=Sphingobium yanoikuyae TaxID=13690 RepID=UPI0015521759|nr:PAS domain-containing sensor histidine kinase [Sphingobium yanoikuyae]